MRRLPEAVAQLAVTAYCAVRSWPLVETWLGGSPYDRLGWLALLAWLCGLAHALWRAKGIGGSFWLSALALLCALAGTAGDLRAFFYLGFAVSLAALPPTSGGILVWACAGISWMPAMGLALQSYLTPTSMIAARLALAAFGTAILLAWGRYMPPSPQAEKKS